LRYILPQILPYTFALIAFSVPGAILTEAGVSFLLGSQGALEVTWGRILNDAQKYSAVLTGMWWWVLPPGFMIALSGLAFVLVGNALDKVLNPRLIR
jgi:peptide/nickel transport system permease protein